MTDKAIEELPWSERVTMLSINPAAATRNDVARMATELSAPRDTPTTPLAEAMEKMRRWNNARIKSLGDFVPCLTDVLTAFDAEQERKKEQDEALFELQEAWGQFIHYDGNPKESNLTVALDAYLKTRGV